MARSKYHKSQPIKISHFQMRVDGDVAHIQYLIQGSVAVQYQWSNFQNWLTTCYFEEEGADRPNFGNICDISQRSLSSKTLIFELLGLVNFVSGNLRISSRGSIDAVCHLLDGRGVRHLRHLSCSPENGYTCYCPTLLWVQGLAKEWSLGCVIPMSWPPLAAGRVSRNLGTNF